MDATFDEPASQVGILRQGHIVKLPALPILTTHVGAMHPAMRKVASSPSPRSGEVDGLAPVLAPISVPSGLVMVVTQTCDLQPRRTLSGRVLAHVAPVVHLSDAVLHDARRGTRPNYVPIPWLGDVMFADLDQLAPVDRGLLAKAELVAAAPEAERRDLAYRTGRYFSRAALPDDVDRALVPLAKIAAGKNDDLKRVLASVHQIRVAADKDYELPPPYSLTIYLVVDADWLPDAPPDDGYRQTGSEIQSTAKAMVAAFEEATDASSGALVTLWARLRKQMRDRLLSGLTERSRGAVADISVIAVTALTVEEIDQTDVLDLGHLSLGSDQ